jgi:hypothetical protein
MRIDINDGTRQRRGRITIDPSQRPPRVLIDEDGSDVFLDWDGSLDDEGHLRKCLICGNSSLFRFRSLPSVTPILVILAFAGFAVSILGYANNPVVLALMGVVLTSEFVILAIVRTQLVCYRCRSTYSDTPIAPYHDLFDPQTADLEANKTGSTSTPDEPEPSVSTTRPKPRRERLAQMRIKAAEEAARGDVN